MYSREGFVFVRSLISFNTALKQWMIHSRGKTHENKQSSNYIWNTTSNVYFVTGTWFQRCSLFKSPALQFFIQQLSFPVYHRVPNSYATCEENAPWGAEWREKDFLLIYIHINISAGCSSNQHIRSKITDVFPVTESQRWVLKITRLPYYDC